MDRILFRPNFDIPTESSKPIPEHSHRRSKVWMWLQAVQPPPGELGDVIRKLSTRRDMNDKFPNRTHLHNYLIKSGIPPVVAGTVMFPLWKSYQEFMKSKDAPDEAIALNLSHANFARAGTSRVELASVILRGFMGELSREGSGVDVKATMEQGGTLAQSAFRAAQAVIEHVQMRQGNRIGANAAAPRKLGNEGTSSNPWKDYDD